MNRDKVMTFVKKSLSFLPDKSYIKLYYQLRVGRKLNTNNPTTLNEKLQWLKFNYRFPLQSIVSDKLLVRDYVKEKIGEEYPPLMEKPMNQKPSLHQMEHYQKFYENGEYVRAVESTTEQNYNMIDGCVNNLPKPRIINGRESVLDKLRIRQMAREKQKSSQEQSADMERNRK